MRLSQSRPLVSNVDAGADAPRPQPLAPFEGARPPAPAWFDAALAAPRVDASIDVDGAAIAWRRWGEGDKPVLMLVHGGVAHLSWWDFIAPFLTRDFAPVALSLSGMGDSGQREVYRMEGFADEVLAVAEAAGGFEGGRKPLVVGHSFGGFVALAAAHRHGGRLAGAVLIDSPVRARSERPTSPPRRRGGRVYATEAEALGRFRLLPDQPCENLFLLDHVAREALKRAPMEAGGQGWAWKHDPDLWPKIDYPERQPADFVPALECPMALMRGGRSNLVGDEIWGAMGELFGPSAPRVDIPEADHHVMLDQPLATVAALNGLLSSWPATS